MKYSLFLALALGLAACGSPPLPELSPSHTANPEAPITTMPYRPVMAGTAAHEPVGLKPWRELNDRVAPRAGRSR